MTNRKLWIAGGAAAVAIALGLVVAYAIAPSSGRNDALPRVAVGTLTVSQPNCDAEDPGGDGILLVEGAGDEVTFQVAPRGAAAAEVLYPGEPYPVLVDDEPVTVIVTPVAQKGWTVAEYPTNDWTVTFAPLGEECR